eukprot:401060_1
MLSLFVALFSFIVDCKSSEFNFTLPYDTEVKQWSFLYEEPSNTLDDYRACEPSDTYDIIYDLMRRVLGGNELLNKFKLQLIIASNSHAETTPIYRPKSKEDHPFWSKPSSLYLDVIQLDNDGTNIILRGSSTIALAVAFNWYLEDYCNTTYDWRTYTIDMPSQLPLPISQQKRRSVPFMYYQNVCTVSYTFAFWDWTIWQKHLDWMAMQGINMPLAHFGFTSSDMATFFAGPGFYAWQRMGNLQGWGGPLRESEIMGQYQLQLQILARMNSFEMTPILTCFAGHVPQAIKTLYPKADVTKSPNWGGFPPQYCCVLLLNVSDPLFEEIGTVFIETQTKYFGTSHIYQCDTFNEMDPSSNSSSYLTAASEYVYNAMNKVDENAIWLMQGWLFHISSSFWNNITISAYLSGVPDDGMIILDLYSDKSPVYSTCDSYFGKPFIWCTLHDFGGVNGIRGNLSAITNGFIDGLNFRNTTIMGIGTTMEGIWQNYIVYDTTYKMGYETKPINLTVFAQRYAYQRYGLPHTISTGNIVIANNLVSAWLRLTRSVYNLSNTNPKFASEITFPPKFGIPKLDYDLMDIQSVWRDFVNVGNVLKNVEKFRYDLIDITRQAMSDLFTLYYTNLTQSYSVNDINNVEYYGNLMIEVASDMDRILLTDIHWMLGDWIGMARNKSNDTDTGNWYEYNARNQISLWGQDYKDHDDYAAKQWGDFVGRYLKPQWELFVNQLIECMKNNSKWNENAFLATNFEMNQLPWQTATGGYHTEPVNDTIIVACDVYKKWNLFGDKTCT